MVMSRWGRMSDEQKERENKRKIEWAAKNRVLVRARKKRHYESKLAYYQAYERNRQYQKMYGITVSDYDAMLLLQKGKCKVCGTDKPGRTRKFFCIDHCHLTGRIRGLLCVGCNVGVGFYEKLHEQISKYLADS